MALAIRHAYSFADYIALEESATTKHEFYAGEIYAMAGGTPEHAALAMAVGAMLIERLRDRSCRVYSSDLRVRVAKTGLTTYPDVTVVCGPVETDPEHKTCVVNPTLLVEVLSDGTDSYDRNEKFEHYKHISTLRAYLLVNQSQRAAPSLEVWERCGRDWSVRKAMSGETLTIESLGVSLPVDDVYR